MPTTQMNLRIDARVKEQGDAVLAQVGYSPSHTARAIWEFAASHIHDPLVVKSLLQQAEVKQDPDKDARIRAKLESLERALCLQRRLEAVVGSARSGEVDDVSDKELRGAALLARWEERGLA